MPEDRSQRPSQQRQTDERVQRELRERFRPELLGRIDHIAVFQPLGADALRRIVQREIRLGLARPGLARRRLWVECDDRLVDRLVLSGTDPRYGARPLQREVRRTVLEPLARWLAAEPATGDRFVTVTLVDGQPTLRHESLREPEVGVSCRLRESESARAEDVPLVTATH